MLFKALPTCLPYLTKVVDTQTCYVCACMQMAFVYKVNQSKETYQRRAAEVSQPSRDCNQKIIQLRLVGGRLMFIYIITPCPQNELL